MEGSADENSTWDRTASCIRKATKEVSGAQEVILVGIKRIGSGMGTSKGKRKQRM